jgi:hypothetical protein
MSSEGWSDLEAERTVICALLQGQEQARDQLDIDSQIARRALTAQIDQLRQHRDSVDDRLRAVMIA